MTRPIDSVRTVQPLDVFISIRGVVYPLVERTEPGEFTPRTVAFEATIAGDPRMMVSAHGPHGGYVFVQLEGCHVRDCHLTTARWDRKAKKKRRGDTCDCGAQAAMDALLARGRV